MATKGEKTYAMPSAMSQRYVKLLVGFLIAVPIGLAPVLGKVAGVDVLLNLFPRSSRGGLIIFSAFLMGAIAAGIQFYSGEILARTSIRKWFRNTSVFLLVVFALLFVFYSLYIEPVPIEHGEKTVAVILGSSRIYGPPCDCAPTDNPIRCIHKLGVGNEAAIETCWDATSIRQRRLLLHSSYLLVMGSIGALIGLLLLQGEARKRQKRRPRKTAIPASPKPEPPHGTS
jgi:hypothetical protein